MLFPYAGILPLPSVVMAVSSASLICWTAAEPQSWVFSAAFPFPSAPWQDTHLVLNVAAPACASAFAFVLNKIRPARHSDASTAARRLLNAFFMFLSSGLD